jgi:(1->4)-alpha-D-glucan 1-alpha-D-glucosylmutase
MSLQDEAKKFGLLLSYHDAFGKDVQVSNETLTLVLDALKLPEDRPRLGPHCLVVHENRPIEIILNEKSAIPVAWLLIEENGQETSGTTEAGALSLTLAALNMGYHKLILSAGGTTDEVKLIVVPARAYDPWAPETEDAKDDVINRRVWGLALQLYGVRSGRNWGIGDFGDLTRMITDSARLGVSVIGINPLHALFPDDPERCSPYSPSSRQFLNWLYIDVESIPEFEQSAAAVELVGSDDFQRELARLRAVPMVDYSGVASAKRRVLELVFAQFKEAHLGKGDSRDRAFTAFKLSHNTQLQRFALFHALREELGTSDWSMRDWRKWPVDYAGPDAPGVEAFKISHAERISYYEYQQFILFEQLAEAGKATKRAGMKIGLYGDLAVGVDTAGAEAWANQDVVAADLSIGAPPDPLAPQGQNWGLPVFNPVGLQRLAYEPFIRTLRATMADFGALRIDHVLGLKRLYAIPNKNPSAGGTYIMNPFAELIGIVALESRRNKCLVIGEDLGNVPDGFREAMEAANIYSYRVLWFEQNPGSYKTPGEYPGGALVTASTHDLPTMAGFWAQSDVSVRERLGLMNAAQIDDLRAEREHSKQKLFSMLHAEGLAKDGTLPVAAPIIEMHRAVARTPSHLMLVQLEDVLELNTQANMPGTLDEHPNWRRKLPLDLPALLAESRMRAIAKIAAEEKRAVLPKNFEAGNTVDPRLAIPASTYRLQFNAGFKFTDATEIIPYLSELGISHVYASSYLEARPGSTHGYDIVDHNALNPEIGNEAQFSDYLRTLNAWRMGQMLDFVPNHMGVGRADNEWWMDVLEWGEESPFASFFDIDWEGADPTLRGKLMVPVLGQAFGKSLAAGEMKLCFESQLGRFSIKTGAHRLPIRPADYPAILQKANLPSLDQVAACFAALFKSAVKKGSRHSQASSLKADLARMVLSDSEIAAAIEKAVAEYNGKEGDLKSWALLGQLVDKQNYRLASWRIASDEINYRRFFDINDLAGLRMENPKLFELAHRFLARLVAQGDLAGVRIDHIDGLYDPQAYLVQLYKYLGRFGAPVDAKSKGRERFYVLVEKIFARDESLRETWPVAGTTGYEFIADVDGLFVDSAAETVFDQTYKSFSGERDSFLDIVRACKLKVIGSLLPADLERLVRKLNRIADRDWNTRDFSLNRLRAALREIVAGFRVYRTYVTQRVTSAEDRMRIGEAVASARAHWDGLDIEILDFVERTLTGDIARGDATACKPKEVFAFVQAFQQYTGPVMAKALEDTAFYRYYRLVSLNEVGNNPSCFGVSVGRFHETIARRAKALPHTMLASSTHDTKRGEDTRARISALSEFPEDWRETLGKLAAIATPFKSDGNPGANDEYMIYQTLLGIWPAADSEMPQIVTRLKEYATKAMREAKVHSSWTAPNEAYEEACHKFIDAIAAGAAFREALQPLCAKLVKFGYINSLVATVLKLTAPGVPDLYQGSELWNFSLADPDNRRPVDYVARQKLMEEAPPLRELLAAAKTSATMESGAIKLRLTQKLLRLRRSNQSLFENGSYEPIEVTGIYKDNVIAYLRREKGRTLLVACGRLTARVEAPGTAADIYAFDWKDTSLTLPQGNWRDRLRDSRLNGGGTLMNDLFNGLPFTVLTDF